MSGAFLTPDHRTDARERERERNIADYHEGIAQSSYRWATAFLVIGMAALATPFVGTAEWKWYLVGGVALIMTVFSIRMMIHGRIVNGLICLFCALAVLPGWVFIAQDVVKVGYELYEIIAKQWRDKFS
ncbi:hypothetical protein WJU23_09370 [Prosthecobacter sp. SYSU 5D2]|uniref:hypothetical protein n=1 Tax=Prosthecobacter sp. SYSU 5D2 TaxID=3134134 RepID=UPI0031FE48A1